MRPEKHPGEVFHSEKPLKYWWELEDDRASFGGGLLVTFQGWAVKLQVGCEDYVIKDPY